MGTSTAVVSEFFHHYEQSRNTFDVGLIDSQYPEAFMFAGPNGVRVTEKPAVLAALAKGQQLFKGLGHTSTKLVSLSETALDAHYTMVRAQFVWRFDRGASPIDVDVDSTFILHIRDGVAKTPPAMRPVTTYPVRVLGDAVEVQLPE